MTFVKSQQEDSVALRDREPYVTHATVRESWSESDHPCWDIECRFSDGQKFAAIQVDYNFEELADFICKKIIWEGREIAFKL